MANYRGGERQESSYGQALIKATREGQTRGQKDRDFRNKAIMAAAQAGLMGIGGIISGAASSNLKDEQNQRDLYKSSQKYAAPDYQGPEGAPPEWLGQHGEGNADAIQRAHSMSEAAQAVDRSDANDRAMGAPMGGYMTPDGLEKTHQLGSSMARDMNTAEDEIKKGGMMNSLPRVSR